jgi:glycosyltransferase involved in cell wall biosynthesis/putative flippase GtrA
MKVISIGTDRKLFEEESAVKQRQIKYGKFFDELHIVVFTPNDTKFQNQKLSNNVFLYPTRSKTKIRILCICDFIRIIDKILKNYGKDNVILTCQDPFETGITGAFAKLFFNLPLHIQVHTDLMHKYFRQSSLLNRTRFFMAEFVLKYSDRVRVVSERIKKSIESFSQNIDVLPIKTEIPQEGVQEQSLDIKKPFPFTLLMVCRLEKEKNIETVLMAIKNLEDSISSADIKNIGLCVVGDGSQKSNLEKIAEDFGISEKVVFAGWKNNLAPYYKMADVFVSSSLYEGYGISTMEAAYFGKPLILSETGVSGEIFKENRSAFICDAQNSTCFTKSILNIYRDKILAKKMGQSAKITAEEHLSSERNYFGEYADSVKKAASDFRKRNFISRIFNFKKTAFSSFITLRYFICGITAASINIGSLYIFTDIVGIWYLYSSILSFLLSLIISFTLQKFVVFRDTETHKIHREFIKFFVAAVLGVITNTILIFICVDMFGIWYIFSQIIAGFFVMIQNFILYKFFIFNKK